MCGGQAGGGSAGAQECSCTSRLASWRTFCQEPHALHGCSALCHMPSLLPLLVINLVVVVVGRVRRRKIELRLGRRLASIVTVRMWAARSATVSVRTTLVMCSVPGSQRCAHRSHGRYSLKKSARSIIFFNKRTRSIFSDTFFQRARRGVSASNPLIHVTHHVTSWRSSGSRRWLGPVRDTRLQTRRIGIHTHRTRSLARVNKRRRARRAAERRDEWRADARSSTRTAGGRASGRRNERCHLSFRSAAARDRSRPT